MTKFKLNTLKLTTSGSMYFETFLTTIHGLPIVATSMSTFYAQHPRVADHTVASLFPFLIPQIPFLLAQSNASPFSGAATQRKSNKNKQNKKNKEAKMQPTTPAMGTQSIGRSICRRVSSSCCDHLHLPRL
jgi:hypothetical protein